MLAGLVVAVVAANASLAVAGAAIASAVSQAVLRGASRCSVHLQVRLLSSS